MAAPRVLRSLSLASILALAATGAHAGSLTGEEVLQQFNLVSLGNMSGGHDVEGRALIGGNLTGSSTTFFTSGNAAPKSDFGALTVGGNLNASVNMNNGGSLAIGGNLTKNANMNGGGTAYIGGKITGNAKVQGGPKVVGASVDVPDFSGVMAQLSADLQALTANGTAKVSGNKGVFDASGLGDTVVFNIADGKSFFGSIGEIAFTLGGAETVIVNVGGTTMTMDENWLGGVGKDVADNILWNFYEAENLTFKTEYFGSVLATEAVVRNNNALNGAIVVGQLNQHGRIGQYQFAGDIPAPPSASLVAEDVPEPMSLGLLGLGLLGLIAAHRRADRK